VLSEAPFRPERPVALTWLAGRDQVPAVAWEDELDAGFDPTSSYVETYWLPILGPSATWALRRIAGWLRKAPASGVWVPVEPLARSLGLGASAARNAPVRRALGRLVDFRMARIDEDRDVLVVRTVIPPLGPHAIRRLPAHLLDQHDEDLRAHLARPA
jgi:hypothetical protein